MTNDATRTNAGGLPTIDRSASLARQAQLSAFIDKVMEPQQLLSTDERIEAAIEEIKLSYWEKWPDAPIYIRDLDKIDSGMVIIMTHVDNQAPRSIEHERVGAVWRAKGGERHMKGGEA